MALESTTMSTNFTFATAVHVNDWNLTSIDWSKNTKDDLTENYQDQILAGLMGNPVVSEVQDQYDHIYADSAGISGCAETQQQGFNKWKCPDEITAQNPSEPECELEQVIEDVCIQVTLPRFT